MNGQTWLAFVIAGSLYCLTGVYIYYLIHVLHICDTDKLDPEGVHKIDVEEIKE